MGADAPFDLIYADETEAHLHPQLTKAWAKVGQPAEVPSPGTNEKVPIYGALNCRTNELFARLGSGKNAGEFLGFLAELVVHQGDRPWVLVLDNASYHTVDAVVGYLAELSPRVRVVWQCPYSPELNGIERVWKYLKGACLANYFFGTVADLKGAFQRSLDAFNDAGNGWLKFRDPLSGVLFRSA